MGMCWICGGWDCEFCNPHDLMVSLKNAKENGTEKELVARLINKFEFKSQDRKRS